MFKLVVLSALLAVAAARPGLYETLVYSAPATTTYTVHEPALAHVGNIVKSIPTSVSHASHSVVHGSSHVVQDVLAPVAVKSTAYSVAPALTYAAPPAPLTYTTYAANAPVYKSYAATPLVYNAAW